MLRHLHISRTRLLKQAPHLLERGYLPATLCHLPRSTTIHLSSRTIMASSSTSSPSVTSPVMETGTWGTYLASKVGYETISQEVSDKSFYDLKVEMPGKNKFIDMADYKGKPVLIVNTASKCGFTPQYKGLQKLYEEYQDRGLVIIGFPCDQFGGQEPGTDDQIGEACELNFGVKFPLAKKSDVNGPNMNEVYAWIKSKKGGPMLNSSTIKWNFEKALIGKDGQVIARYSSLTKPDQLKPDIEKAFAA